MWVEEKSSRDESHYHIWSQEVEGQLYVLIIAKTSKHRSVHAARRSDHGWLTYNHPHPTFEIESEAAWELAWNDLAAFLMEELL